MFTIFFDELQRIWRYRWLVIGVAAVLLLGATMYIMRMPNIYDATAQVFVNKETPVSAAAHGVSLVGDNFGSAYVVQKTLLDDRRLKGIVVRLDPSAVFMDRPAMARAIASLRAKIRIDPDQGDGFIQIHCQDTDPVRARDIVRFLLDQFIAANITRNSQELRRAGQFLDQQIAVYAVKSRAADSRLIAFARAHPAVTRSTGLDTGEAATDVASAQSAYTAALMARGNQGAQAPDNSQIAALRARIATLRMEYTDQYPDIVAAKRQLDALTAQAAAVPQTQAQDTGEPSFIRAARNALAGAQARLRQARQGPPPSPLDAEWADLKKKSAMLRGTYEEMLSRREATRLSEAVYADKNSGKYQITSPPTVPPLPTGPNRRLYLLLAAAVSLGLGVAAAYLRGSINGIFVAPRELEEAFGLPVAGTVSLEKAWQTKGIANAARRLTALTCIAAVLGTGGILTASRCMALTDSFGGDGTIRANPVEIEMPDDATTSRDRAR
jgi:polysaccharide chain length determinant protein (PEP-CTERM system associated)